MLAAALLQAALELTGVVLGPGGKPLPGARIEAAGRTVRADAKGRFALPAKGPVDLRISATGMVPQVRRARPGEPVWVLLEPVPQEATVEVVEGSGYSSEEGTTTTLTRQEIYTTPGAAADVMQAAKGLPGVSNTSEGAELYVRGGRPDEVGIWLNGGRLSHPFHHPTTQGGIFSSVDTALVTKVDFIPGAFSARYGDALSAVLDISTDQPAKAATNTLLLDLAGQGFMFQRPVGPGLLRASVRHADPVLLDKWWGLAANFDESPVSYDYQLNWQQDLAGGRLLVTGLFSRDHLATTITIANLNDVYLNRSDVDFGSVLWTGTVGGKVGLLLQAAADRSNVAWTFNRWGLAQEGATRSGRVEATLPLGEGRTLEAGVDLDRQRLESSGTVPFDLTNWNPDAQARTFAFGYDAARTGAYATVRWLFGPRWGLSLGGRQDHYALEGETTHDVRATLSWLVQEGVTVRFAGGSFHQAPALTELDPHAGNPALRVLRADHVLASLDAAWTRGAAWNLRLEVYRKDYGDLVVQDPVLNYVSTGRGYAQGVDLLVKATTPAWRGWIGYGYLDTRRREDTQLALGPVPTSVPHNITAVSIHTLAPGLELGATFRYASGAPVTPVLGALPNPGGGWDPVDGPMYSDRLPAYGRLDLRLTKLFTWKGGQWVTFAEVMNLLDRHNVSAYSYTPDYSERSRTESYFSRRILVAGVSLTW